MTLHHWLAELPEEVLSARPWLRYWYAWMLIAAGDFEGYRHPLAVAERIWREEGNSEGLGRVYNMHASVALTQGNAASAIRLARRALPLLSVNDLYGLGFNAIARGGSRLLTGDVRDGQRLLGEARDLCREAGNTFGMLWAMNLLADAHVAEGKLHRAADASRDVISLVGDRPILHAGLAHARLGALYQEWNDLEAGMEHARTAVTLASRTEQDIYESPIYLALAQLYRSEGNPEEALRSLDRAESAARLRGYRYMVTAARALRVRVWLAHGDLAKARNWSLGSEASVHDEPAFELEPKHLALVRELVSRERGSCRDDGAELAASIGLLQRLLSLAESQGRNGSAIEILVVGTLAHEVRGEAELAEHSLQRALSLAEPAGYVRMFVDEGAPMESLLRRISAPPDGKHYIIRRVPGTRSGCSVRSARRADPSLLRRPRHTKPSPGANWRCYGSSPRGCRWGRCQAACLTSGMFIHTMVPATFYKGSPFQSPKESVWHSWAEMAPEKPRPSTPSPD